MYRIFEMKIGKKLRILSKKVKKNQKCPYARGGERAMIFDWTFADEVKSQRRVKYRNK